MKKIIEWYKKSNRYKHAATGGIILAVFLLVGVVVAVNWFANLLLASGTVLVAMASAENIRTENMVVRLIGMTY